VDWNSVTCQGDQNKCAWIYLKQSSVETFIRDCVTEKFCNDKPPCEDPKLDKCSIKCCDKDKCNDKKPTFAENDGKV